MTVGLYEMDGKVHEEVLQPSRRTRDRKAYGDMAADLHLSRLKSSAINGHRGLGAVAKKSQSGGFATFHGAPERVLDERLALS